MTRSDYDRKHRAERARWAPIVAAGSVLCTRCLRPILVGQSWHLDHDDTDRTRLSRCACGGPNGVVVDVVRYVDKLGYDRKVYRLSRHHVFIGE